MKKNEVNNRRYAGFLLREVRALIIFFSFILLASCADINPETKGGLVMDTVFTVTVYGDEKLPGELLEAADQLDKTVLSRFNDNSLVVKYTEEVYESNGSEVYDFNGNRQTDDVDRRHAMSGYSASVAGTEYNLYELFSACEDMRENSAGAFDVRIGALSDLWNIKGNMTKDGTALIPAQAQIVSVIEDRSVLDLGSVGKGIYLDLASDILEGKDVTAAIISAGGSVLVYGKKPDGSDFKVAVRNPFSESSQDAFGTIILSGTHFISTSGSYERYFEYGGERYHHIINPLSGYPAWTKEDIENRNAIPALALSGPAPIPEQIPVSVTVISDSGFYSDALSTACFVLGPDMGISLAEKYSSEVIYIMDDGTVITSHGIIYDSGNKIFKLK